MPFGKKASSAGATDILQKFSDLYSNSSGEEESSNASSRYGTLKKISPSIELGNDLRRTPPSIELGHDLRRTSPSIELGNDLVQKLLVQLTMNDSPPSNVGITKNKKLKEASAIKQGEFLSPLATLSKAEMAHINQLSVNGPISLQQQGHIALAKLCTRALANLGKESHFLAPQKKNLSNQTSTYGNKKSRSIHWMKKKSKISSPGDGSDSREGRDVLETSRNTKQESARLQLFGSEYARFLSTTPLAPKNVSNSKRATSRSIRNNGIQTIEDADKQAATGPITDIIITKGDEPLPKGYYRISKSLSGKPFFFGDRKSPLFLCVKKERNWDRAAQRPCVTAISIIFPERKEFVPPGFSLIYSKEVDSSSSARVPINLNLGDGEPAYLCYRRSREGNPLTGILPLFPMSREQIPEGYTVLERTPRNFVANLRVTNVPIFLAYRQRLANLELLRPAPLVKSLLKKGSKSTRLEAYFCTGGTIVGSKVGRFHIMDRSTHSLLSPNTIKHRLALIEVSRKKTLNSFQEYSEIVGGKYAYSDTASTTTSVTSATTSSHFSMQSSVRDFDSVGLSSEHSLASISVYDDTLLMPTKFSGVKKDFDRCKEALDFIPYISSASQKNSSRDLALFKARVSILVPVLTSCYTKHGGAALLSIEGLLDLLRQDFFEDDVEMSRDPSSEITLLDLSIQIVCDVATMGAQETHLHTCVEFVEEAVKYGCGYLNTRTLGYLLRFYLFVFYFGISSPKGNWGVASASDQYLLEDNRSNTSKLALPGGAPQSAILSMKDLVVFMIARLGSQVHFDQCARTSTTNARTEKSCHHFSLIDSLVNEVVDSSIFRVDIANFAELAMHQIRRSGGSELFWYEMINLCDSSLFGNDKTLRKETRHMYAVCFAFLANCVKNASSRVRRNEKGEGSPRDTANKLMSLEMLKFFLEKWESGLDSHEIQGSYSLSSFAFCIRRLVVPCLLANTHDALADPRIFRRVIQIVGVLWCSPFYRKHMKLEIGILFNHFVLRLLKLGPQILFRSDEGEDRDDRTYLFAQQLGLMKEIKNWFRVDTERFLELNLNFDSEYWTEQVKGTKDLLPGHQWRISEQLCSFLCNLAEECTEFLGDKIRESQVSSPMKKSTKEGSANKQDYEGMSTMTLARESARRLRQGALDAVSQIVKVLAMSASASIGEEFSNITDAWYYGQKYDLKKGARPVEGKGSALVVGFWHKMEVAKNMKNDSFYSEGNVVVGSNVDVSERKKKINVAFSISREKGLIKAIEYLIACNVLTASPREISSFLRIHCGDLDPAALGRYLGEGGSDHAEAEFWNQIRFNFIRAISFVGMSVVEGLRHLLTQGGFRLPGEAQQIDRLIAMFARCYWEDNAGDRDHCPIENQDSIYLLSFAIILLNTDLHKSHHSSTKNRKKNQQKKMTKEEFITNIQRANKNVHIRKDYLSSIYDEIKDYPIVLRTGIEDKLNSGGIESSDSVLICIEQMTENVKSLDSLLRGLAIHEYRYVSLQDYCIEFDGSVEAATTNLARSFMTKSWHQFHGLINSTLKIAHLDPKAMESCIDLLKFALCSTIILDMPTEQVAFLDQLGRFRLFNAWRRSNDGDETPDLSFQDQETYKKERWYRQMREISQSNPGAEVKRKYAEKFESMILLDRVVDDMALLSVSLDGEAAKRKRIRDVVRRIEDAEYLLNDPTRSFVREGNMMKRSNRSKRITEYRFFLFSDILIYAKKIKSSTSDPSCGSIYRIHEELPLIRMKVIDWFPPDMKKEDSARAIQFHHPRKMFMAFCSDTMERKSWVDDIREAIDKELQRKIATENARKAASNVNVNTYSV